MTTGVAILGCGLVGRKRALAAGARARVLAVYDVDMEKARALRASLPDAPLVAASAEDACATDGVDLVVVAAVHSELAALSTIALRAGRHVLVEKPGARSVAELAAVRGAAAAAGRLVRVGFNHRFHPAPRRAQELVRSGEYGPVLYVRARYGHGGRVGYEREWRADPALSGGGELLDQGAHLVDLTRWVAGDVRLAFASLRTSYWSMPVEDNAFLALDLPDGGVGWLHASWTEWKNLFSFEIALRTAKLEISGLGGSYGTERLTLYEMGPDLGPPATTSWEWPQTDRSWEDELGDVLDEIAGRPGHGAGLAEAAAVLAVIDEVYER